MKSKVLHSFIVSLSVLLLIAPVVSAGDSTFQLHLSLVAQDDTWSTSLLFNYHTEYGEVLRNGNVVGNYRIYGFGYNDPFLADAIKAGDLYIEIYDQGYIFTKFMTSEDDLDYYTGMIIGGTDSFLRYRGTITGYVPQEVGVPVPITLDLFPPSKSF